MIYFFIWVFIGSFAMNLGWIEEHQKTLQDFDYWKESKYRKHEYAKSLIIGLILGPFMLKGFFSEKK